MALVQVRHPATFIVAALIAPLAPADCVDGVRQATPAEREAAQRGWAALLAGLPEAVRPLERRTPKRGDPAAPATFSACRDTPIGAFSPAAAEGYMYQFPREEAAARSEQRRALQRQVEELEKLPPEKEAQRKEIEAQMRAAYAAAPTRSRKDPPFTAERQAQVDRQGRPVVRFQTAQNRDVVARLDATTGAITASVDLGPTAFSSSLNTLTFDSAGNTYAGLGRFLVRIPPDFAAAGVVQLEFGQGEIGDYRAIGADAAGNAYGIFTRGANTANAEFRLQKARYP